MVRGDCIGMPLLMRGDLPVSSLLHPWRRSPILPVLALALTLAGCGASAPSTATTSSVASKLANAFPTAATLPASTTTATAAATTVLVRTDSKLGQLLTDPSGRTLYWYTKDQPGASSCTGNCLQSWPPFSAPAPLTLPPGVPGKLATITRSEGGTQVTYDDMPVYYFAKDAKPGDATGQAVGKVWFVIAPTNGPLVTPTP